jgi:hypothetical protein
MAAAGDAGAFLLNASGGGGGGGGEARIPLRAPSSMMRLMSIDLMRVKAPKIPAFLQPHSSHTFKSIRGGGRVCVNVTKLL